MLNQNAIYVILFSLPVYQLLFYTVQLITFRRISPSKAYLGFILLGMTAFLIMNAIYHLDYHQLFSNLYYIFIPVLLCIAPVYFLYILSITHEDYDVSKRDKLLFFSPAVLVLLLNLFNYGLLPEESRLAFIRQGFTAGTTDGSGVVFAEVVFWSGAVVLLAAQLILAGLKVRKILLSETAKMLQKPAYLAYLDWNWVMYISGSVALFLVVNGLIDVIAPSGNIAVAVIYNVLMLVAGGTAGFYGMKQNSLLIQVSKMAMPAGQTIQQKTVAGQPEIPKAVDFISIEETDRIRASIVTLMSEQKPYLNPEFGMNDLCRALNESRRKVTYVINDAMDKNFYGIVNDYRVKEAIELLSKDENNNFKIEVISEMVGFSSKSSFNACFKKFTGQTPSEYKASVLIKKGAVNS